MSSFAARSISSHHRRKRSGSGIIGNTLHLLGRLANEEHAFKYSRGVGPASVHGYIYIPKKQLDKQFAGGRLRRRNIRRS